MVNTKIIADLPIELGIKRTYKEKNLQRLLFPDCCTGTRNH